jgi:hypothetical protein
MLPTSLLLHLFPGVFLWLGSFSYHILVREVCTHWWHGSFYGIGQLCDLLCCIVAFLKSLAVAHMVSAKLGISGSQLSYGKKVLLREFLHGFSLFSRVSSHLFSRDGPQCHCQQFYKEHTALLMFCWSVKWWQWQCKLALIKLIHYWTHTYRQGLSVTHKVQETKCSHRMNMLDEFKAWITAAFEVLWKTHYSASGNT